MVFRRKSEEKRIEELERENLRLRRSVEELSALNDLARQIGASSDPEQIMRKIISRSVQAVEAEQGATTLVDEDKQNPLETLVRTMGDTGSRPVYHADLNLAGWMLRHRRPLRIHHPQNDDRFRGVSWDDSIGSIYDSIVPRR